MYSPVSAESLSHTPRDCASSGVGDEHYAIRCKCIAGGASPECMHGSEGQPWGFSLAFCIQVAVEAWAGSWCGSWTLAETGMRRGWGGT